MPRNEFLITTQLLDMLPEHRLRELLQVDSVAVLPATAQDLWRIGGIGDANQTPSYRLVQVTGDAVPDGPDPVQVHFDAPAGETLHVTTRRCLVVPPGTTIRWERLSDFV